MRVLLIVHGFPPSALGGTELYTHDLARVLQDRFGDEVFVLTREADPGRPEYSVRRERRDGLAVVSVNHTFRWSRSFEDTYRNDAIRRIGARLLDEIRPDVAHILHLTCLSTDLVAECASRGVPTIFTLNDYWLICHRGQLLDVEYRRCPGPSPETCGHCLGVAGAAGAGSFRAARALRTLEGHLPAPGARALRRVAQAAMSAAAMDPGAGARAMEKRVRYMRWICGRVTRFLAPSRTIRERFLEFGIEGTRMLRQEQGIDQTGFDGVARVPADRLRVGFLGSLIASKGPHVLLEAFAGLPSRAASLALYGAHAPYHEDDRYRARLEPLLAQAGVCHVGPIPHAQVPSALASIDVLVVPSIWIENAPFVIREAFAAGIPVMASNLGGMAEMVMHERNGLLFEPGDHADLRRALRRLIDEPDLLGRLRAGIPRVKTMEEDAAWTREVYRACVASVPTGETPSAPGSAGGGEPRLAAVVLNYRTPEETFLAVRSVQGSRRPVQDLIVVDNGSGDGSEAFLRQHLPEVSVLQTGANRGFSRGSNAGIRAALDRGADLVLLVNSDVVVPPDCVGRLEEALGAESRAGIAAPVILSRSDPDQVESTGMRFSRLTGRMRHEDSGRVFASLTHPPWRAVDGVSGAVLLIRRPVLERTGLLAEDYFFSFEDLDLCLRARAQGFLVLSVGSAVAYHEGSRSIGPRSARRIYFATRNHLLVARRASPLRNPLLGLLRGGSILALNVAHVLFTGPTNVAAGLVAALTGAWHHARGRYGDGP